MLAVWSLVVPVLSMLLVGAPLRGLLARGKLLDESGWIQVPFVGIAVTVLILQFELYQDIRVRDGVFGLWGIAGLLWLLWLWKGCVRESVRNFPVLPFALFAVVLAIQSAGLIALGANDYVGRCWSDQFNYTAMAECFRNHGFAISFADIGQRPWLARVVELKNFRIGQSVLQAYHGVVTLSDTRIQFMPTILLTCPLIALALYAAGLASGLKRGHAALAGLFGGLVPGVTMLAQESFLSHALGIPWLLLLPTLLTGYLVARDVASFTVAALGMAALASIYPEFLTFALVLGAGFMVLALAQRQRRLPHVLGFAVLLAAPWLLNPLQNYMLAYLSPSYLTAPAILAHIYPWGYHHDGLGVIWTGDICLETGRFLYMLVGLRLGRAVVAGGTLGLMVLVVGGSMRWWRGGRHADQAAFGLPLALLGLAFIPALLFVHDQEHPYQFFKMLITVSPLYAFGVVALAARLADALPHLPRFGSWGRVCLGAIWMPVLVGVSVAGVASWRLVLQSTRPAMYANPALGLRMTQYAALNDDFRELRRELESLHGENILIRPWGPNPYLSMLWASYFGRFNQLWLADSRFNDGLNLLETPGLVHLADLTKAPPDCLVLTAHAAMLLQPPKALPASAVIWRGKNYTLWKLDNRPWACITRVDGQVDADVRRFWWLGLRDAETTFHLFATQPGIANLTVNVSAGPDIDQSAGIRLLLKDPRGMASVVECPPGELVLPIYLEGGVSTVTVKVLNEKRRTLEPGPCPVLVNCQIVNFELQPESLGGTSSFQAGN